MNQEFRPVKTIFQRPDGLWPIADDNLLNDAEFEKLRGISNYRWIIILHPHRVRTTDPDSLNLHGLKEETLRKIADEKELTSEDIEDIKNNINGAST